MSTVYIDSFEEASHALRQRNLAQGLYDIGGVLMDGVLVNLHGDAHRARRNLESKAFRRDIFRYYEREIFPPTLEKTLRPFLEQGGADLVDLGFRTLLNLTADFAGIDRPEQTAEETETLLRLMKTFAQGATLAHSKRDHDDVRAEVRAALAEYDTDFLQPSIARRKALLDQFAAGTLSEDALPRDVLTVLIRDEDGLELPADVLLREMGFFLVAGAQTSIHALAHAMHEIFMWCKERPEERAKIESDSWFLQRCIQESTRLHPASHEARRQPVCPVRLASDREVDKDDLVIISLIEANRDPKIFGEDADKFNPYREIPAGANLYGVSFGLGMHACIGRNLAEGVLPPDASETENRQLGVVTLIAKALLEHGARPDPDNPARMDDKTERPNWGNYPILLDRPASVQG